jgi:hypothetical protein
VINSERFIYFKIYIRFLMAYQTIDATLEEPSNLDADVSDKTKPSKNGLFKKIFLGALGLFTAFYITNATIQPAYAGGSAGFTNDGKGVNIGAPGNSSSYGVVNNQTVIFPGGGQIGYTANGQIFKRPGYISDEVRAAEEQRKNQQKNTYTNSSNYERIKQEVEMLVQNKSPLNIIREKVANAEETLNNKKELMLIYNKLGNELQEQNRSEALFYYTKASKLGPEYKKHFESVVNALK